jgi:hypothetical protein
VELEPKDAVLIQFYLDEYVSYPAGGIAFDALLVEMPEEFWAVEHDDMDELRCAKIALELGLVKFEKPLPPLPPYEGESLDGYTHWSEITVKGRIAQKLGIVQYLASIAAKEDAAHRANLAQVEGYTLAKRSVRLNAGLTLVNLAIFLAQVFGVPFALFKTLDQKRDDQEQRHERIDDHSTDIEPARPVQLISAANKVTEEADSCR